MDTSGFDNDDNDDVDDDVDDDDLSAALVDMTCRVHVGGLGLAVPCSLTDCYLEARSSTSSIHCFEVSNGHVPMFFNAVPPSHPTYLACRDKMDWI